MGQVRRITAPTEVDGEGVLMSQSFDATASRGIVPIVLVAIAILVAGASAGGQRSTKQTIPPTAPFAVASALPQGDGVTLRLDTRAFESLRTGPGHRRLLMPISVDQSLTLTVERFDVTTPATKFVRATAAKTEEVSTPTVVLFRGRVDGDPDSHVFVTLGADGSANGYIDRANGDRYFVSSGSRVGIGGSDITVHRAASASGYPDFTEFCGADHVSPIDGAVQRSVASAIAAGPLLGGPYMVKVAIDADQAFVDMFHGNVAAAETYVVQVIGAVSDIYQRDLDVRLRLDFVRTWPAGSEPFGADDLGGFYNYWVFSDNPDPYNLIHLMSGRRDTSYGGIAYVTGPCTGSGYAISAFLLGSFPTPVDGPDLGNWDVVVVAHEMGHNMGTYHTHDGYSPPIDSCGSGVHKRSTIMSYCHTTAGGLLNTEMRFHARVQDVLTGVLNTSSCLILDCNGNDVDDFLETSFGQADDANGNHVPDECEDCNGNGTLDTDDVLGGASDVNNNDIPDECEADCNTNGTPDESEITALQTADVNGNLIPDVCEPDCDGNGVADHVDIDNGTYLDLDRNSVPDQCQDCDSNGVSDWLDLQRQHNIYVADRGGFVREFHSVAGVGAQSLGAGILSDPMGVVFGADRQLYVASHGNDRVVKIDVDTGVATDVVAAGAGGLDGPSDLLFRSNGNLLVAGRFNNAVLEFDGATGAYLGHFVAAGSGGLTGPYGLTFGPGGDLYVSDSANRVLRYSGASGAFVGEFVSAGSGGLSGPRDLAFLPDGRLLVASYNNNRVLHYDATGAPFGQFDNGPEVTGAWGILVKPDGNVLAGRSAGSIRIMEYASDGFYLRSFIRGDEALAAATMFAVRPASVNDCNQNLVLDHCDVLVAGAPDCNGNLVPDGCDLANLALNCDGNEFVDSCECVPSDAPTNVVGAVAKNRYVSFVPPIVGCDAVALRTTLTALPPPFVDLAGAAYFVQMPQEVIDPVAGPFWAARLGCDPLYLDWNSFDVIHLYGEEIVPRGTYTVQSLDRGCNALVDEDYSTGPDIDTAAVWGDIEEPFAPQAESPQPDFYDIAAAVKAFVEAVDAPPMVQADLYNGVPDRVIDFRDIALVVSGFVGSPYPFAGPTLCP